MGQHARGSVRATACLPHAYHMPCPWPRERGRVRVACGRGRRCCARLWTASGPPLARLAPPAQAGSLAAALDDHNELPDLGEVSDHLSLSSNQRRARRIAVCTMGLTVLFMLGMVHLMHRSLREIREDHRAKEESETEPLVQTPIRDTVSRMAV